MGNNYFVDDEPKKADPSAGTGLVSRKLLDKIDGLFACNVGEHIALPQLVVVGNQSSGKSSVLEALTELPFPRDSGLCTRFATQITFRRATTTNTTASIIPAKNASVEYAEKLKGWKKTDIQGLSAASFADIMKEVTEVMDIGTEKSKTFSEDVLRLEVSGPEQEHYSVIDVPGIFKRTVQGLTTKEDMAMVDQMVQEYMSNPRSVILPVIPCNVDIATQEILQKAEELDPQGKRTLGILTKPDLVDRGAEKDIVAIIEGKAHTLQHGWHLLRNPGHSDKFDTAKDRQRFEESFFATTSPWNGLEKANIGVKALQSRLQKVLADHVREQFGAVRTELNGKLKTAKQEMLGLGPRRQTQTELNMYMADIASEFKHLVELALQSNYSQSTLFEEDKNLRLATMAVNRGETFSKAMASAGHTFEFENAEEPVAATDALEIPFIKRSEKSRVSTRNSKATYESIEDIMEDVAPVVSHAKTSGIIDCLKQLYFDSRGFGLGSFNAAILSVTMKEQAENWHGLALGYTADIIVLVHGFIVKALESVVLNERVREGIMSLLLEGMRDKYAAAMDRAKFLLEVELESAPATHNHYFNDILEKCREERLRKELQGKVISNDELGEVVRLEDIATKHPLSNSEHIVREIHDNLRAYYKVALKRFVDNVRMQVADYFLVLGPKTPLMLFSPKFVSSLSPEQLEDIAGEELIVKNKRAKLEKTIKELEEGKKILSMA